MEEEHSPQWPLFYYLDESDPDIVILRRSGGQFVAAFIARGATTEGLIVAAQEDYRQLLALALAAESSEPVPSFDQLPEHVAIVDRSGAIVAVNEAWRRFARDNGGDSSKVLEGANYLDICDRATGEYSEYAESFAEGLRSVLFDREEHFALEYPCHSPIEKRWFIGRVRPLPEAQSPMAIVAHENITWRKLSTE